MEKRTIIIVVTIAIVSLIVGGLIGYYAIPKKEGYSQRKTSYKSEPSDTKLNTSELGKKANEFIRQAHVGIAYKGDSTIRPTRIFSSGKEAYAAPAYDLV